MCGIHCFQVVIWSSVLLPGLAVDDVLFGATEGSIVALQASQSTELSDGAPWCPAGVCPVWLTSLNADADMQAPVAGEIECAPGPELSDFTGFSVHADFQIRGFVVETFELRRHGYKNGTALESTAALVASLEASCATYDRRHGRYELLFRPTDIMTLAEVDFADLLEQRCGVVTFCKHQPSPRFVIEVPTYPGDTDMYILLVQSLVMVQTPDAEFVTIFSSMKDMDQMLTAAARGCLSAAPVHKRFLIYNTPPGSSGAGVMVDKWTYQAFKKLWGWHHLQYDYLFQFDSDFEIIQPISLENLVEKHAKLMYKTIPDQDVHRDVDVKVMQRSNRILGTDFDFFPLDGPWILNKSIVTAMFTFLASVSLPTDKLKALRTRDCSGNHAMDILLYGVSKLCKSEAVYEIILYRFYALDHFPEEHIQQLTHLQPHRDCPPSSPCIVMVCFSLIAGSRSRSPVTT